MLRYIFLFLLLFSFNSCTREPTPFEQRVMLEFPTEELSRIVWELATDLKYGRRLRLEESYVVAGAEHTTLRLEFITQDLLEVWQARELLVDIVEGLLNWINHDEIAHKLRPYPFTADQLEIYVKFESFHGIYVDPNFVGWMVLENGMSYFYAFSLSDDTKDCWKQRIEPYHKSRSFVMHEREADAKYRVSHPKHRHSALGGLRYIRPPE